MDHDKIVNNRVQRIARDHSCSAAEVNAALDHHPIELDRDMFLKRTLAMELVELDELQTTICLDKKSWEAIRYSTSPACSGGV